MHADISLEEKRRIVYYRKRLRNTFFSNCNEPAEDKNYNIFQGKGKVRWKNR